MPTSDDDYQEPPVKGDGEFVSFDPKTGRKTDAVIHNRILSGIHPTVERNLLKKTKAMAAEMCGFSKEELDDMYGKD